ncbi:flagellar motor switch protein FliN/FliY [Virgibacillus natechei]|uniref:Flagellar motor switch protein FliN/FliY n=1 Tax=Virgibacillus natechei TaxID=1216297 RepID=A0ABS4ICM9_9BACI|nr:flagellar motor switch phosphatase FliY [Virgibacillus natechei]MBP1968091.1 flagellar motor switch protein FliN/FliY [Virgibacillus natechei]UZD14628.1 flagellar motor switch phosphatase FliY [Virgibacillus natechei]
MMNDGMLSQDEIDALLKVSSDNDVNEIDYLSTIEEDTLGEIGNISFGNSATTLSSLLNQKVEITTPSVSIIQQSDLEQEFNAEAINISVNYTEGFIGNNVFVMQAEAAAIISDIMLGGDGTSPEEDLTEIHLSAVQEAMNQMMGAAATSMSSVFNKKVDITPPSITSESNSKPIFDEDAYVKVSFQLKIGNLIDSIIMQLIPFPFAKQLVEQLMNKEVVDEAAVAKEPIEKQSQPKAQMKKTTEEPTNNTTNGFNTNPQYLGNSMDQSNADIQHATFSSFNPVELNKNEQRNLDMLLDVPLKVTVELGRTKRSIKDILDLAPGSIIELDKLAGEPVDIMVNEKLVAKGEVVVIDENFGVRVSDIISQTDRLMKLK